MYSQEGCVTQPSYFLPITQERAGKKGRIYYEKESEKNVGLL